MKTVRIVSNGYTTQIEIDGKPMGRDIKSVVFIHDTTGKYFEDGYTHPVLQLISNDDVEFDSRFDKGTPDFKVDTDASLSFDSMSDMVMKHLNNGEDNKD